jgi:hypothetical protein
MNRILALALFALFACKTPTPIEEKPDASVAQSKPSLPHRRAPRGMVAKPKAPDTRTPEQLATAACSGPKGWRCSSPQPRRMGAAARPPITPTTWTIPNWWVDPVNGLDTNPGTSISTPVQHWYEIIARYGTINPRLAQDTVWTWLSSDTAALDPVQLWPTLADGANALFNGTLTVLSTGTFGAITTKSRASNQLWNVNMQVNPASFVGQFAADTTRSSYFWIYASISGDVVSLSQPLQSSVGVYTAAYAVAPNQYAVPPLAELDTITTGDSWAVYSMPQVTFVKLGAVMEQYNPNYGNGIQVQHMYMFDINGSSSDTFYAGPNLAIIESRSDRLVNNTFVRYNDNLEPFNNDWFDAVLQTPSNTDVIGGVLGFLETNSDPGGPYYNPNIDGDAIVQNAQIETSASLGQVYFGSPGNTFIEIDGEVQLGTNSYTVDGGSIGILWGNSGWVGGCTLASYKGANILYGGGFANSTATSTFLFDGEFCINDGITAYSVSSSGTWAAGPTINPTNLDHPISDGGYGGCAVAANGSGGRICSTKW